MSDEPDRMTAEERAKWRIRDDQCDVWLSERLPNDSACLLPLPCPSHGPRPSDEPTERDVETLARIINGGGPPPDDWRTSSHWKDRESWEYRNGLWLGAVRKARQIEVLIAEARREGAAEAHGIRFRVGTACDGYASLAAADVPDGIFDEEDYYLGAQHAAEGIRAALRGDA